MKKVSKIIVAKMPGDVRRNLAKLERGERPFRIVANSKRDPYFNGGFTHRKVFEGGGFLYLHRDHVESATRTMERINKKSKRA